MMAWNQTGSVTAEPTPTRIGAGATLVRRSCLAVVTVLNRTETVFLSDQANPVSDELQ
jgi:hypothetical protein